MFTGLIREVGTVASFEDGRLRVGIVARRLRSATRSRSRAPPDGVDGDGGTLAFDVSPRRSPHDARPARRGVEVNVEPALRAGEPLGGHYVQGHVDGVGPRPLRRPGRRTPGLVDAPPEVLRYCVEKGSITVDGVSLTIAALDDAGFAVALIPHTLEVTTLGASRPATTSTSRSTSWRSTSSGSPGTI